MLCPTLGRARFVLSGTWRATVQTSAPLLSDLVAGLGTSADLVAGLGGGASVDLVAGLGRLRTGAAAAAGFCYLCKVLSPGQPGTVGACRGAGGVSSQRWWSIYAELSVPADIA